MKTLKHHSLLIWVCCLFTACSANPPEEIASLKVMSYNLKHGLTMTLPKNGDAAAFVDIVKKNLPRQCQIITQQQADLVGLQEIDNMVTRSGNSNQTQALAQLTGLRGHFAPFMPFQGGEYGLSILSKFPLDRVEDLKLPPGKHEPRTAIIATIHLAEGVDIAFVNVHFDWFRDSAERLLQAQALLKRLDEINLPSIVIGDYNANYDTPTTKAFEQAGFVYIAKQGSRLTMPANKPRGELDHMFFRNAKGIKFVADKIIVLDEKEASDHRPIVTQIRVLKK